ncbi:Leucyl/phenylalanyl-tRNA--protein transferase [hydrothermal vent metagenome]|uniref:Leucyl/phenylalanyl-tRNA--protein transferase n=1 Tax=hydrothermal vent metagenome TaxID=652676 RepID=A0A3B0S6Q4_9ZZZZ
MTQSNLKLTPDLLLRAYAAGVFPMAKGRDDPKIFWVDPRHRGILPLDGFHISRSLARRMRKGDYKVRLNGDFTAAVAACANRDETWINEEIFNLYNELHQMGSAHSFEVYQDGQLTGGVYGVTIGAAFFGESMFSTRTDASKLALAHLVDHLRLCGFQLFDTQFITPHLARLGAQGLGRATYHRMLEDALQNEGDITSRPVCDDPYSVLQRNTQTS